MIQVVISKKKDTIHTVDISGHANSTKGELDLVCAEVSGISVGILNALDILCNDSCDFKMESGHIEIKVKSVSETQQIILSTFVIQLETVAFTNHKYIKIKKDEV